MFGASFYMKSRKERKEQKMESNLNNRTAKRSLYMMNIFLLSIHVSLFLFFTILKVTLMSCVNIFSVLWYVVSFALLKKEKTTAYIFGAFLEVMVHMFLAVVSMGWDFGFQLYFIGCIVIVFYADYFSVRLGNHHVTGIGFSVVNGTLYISSLLVTRFFGSIYILSEKLAFAGMIINSLVIIAFVTVFIGMLTKIASYYEEELVKQATHDKLTGMVNRHYLVEKLDNIYASGEMSSYWLAILDIDNFKGINDKYGHLCGDFVLKTLAQIIKKLCGDRTVCRWGGEEFVIVGSDPEKDEKGRSSEGVLLEDIRRNVAIKDFVYDNDTVINLTVTIGVARYQAGQKVDEWVNVADNRLYHGKQIGKNKVVSTDE